VIVSLANILIRQAEKTDNPRAYLDDIITSKVDTISTTGGVIISATVNGKSTQLMALPGTSVRDVMLAADMALSCLERGLTRVPRQTQALIR
jgi:hypothetical protein